MVFQTRCILMLSRNGVSISITCNRTNFYIMSKGFLVQKSKYLIIKILFIVITCNKMKFYFHEVHNNENIVTKNRILV